MIKQLLLVVVAIVLLPCTLACACPPCGPTEVPYPLSTSPSCGNTSYSISCINEKLYFNSTNNTYPIISIKPNEQRLTIAPSSVDPRTCEADDLPHNGLQLSEVGPFNITGSNTIFYANCNDSIRQSPLDCSTNNLCHVYINATLGGPASPCSNTTCCTMKAGGSTTAYRIRLEESRCRAYMSFVYLDSNLPPENWTLRAGVELEWASLPNSTCGPGPSQSPTNFGGV